MAWEDEDKVNNDSEFLKTEFTGRLYEIKDDAKITKRKITNLEKFEDELVRLINCYSMENGSNTPDFMLANYLVGCLKLWNSTLKWREKWYGRVPEPGDTPEGLE